MNWIQSPRRLVAAREIRNRAVLVDDHQVDQRILHGRISDVNREVPAAGLSERLAKHARTAVAPDRLTGLHVDDRQRGWLPAHPTVGSDEDERVVAVESEYLDRRGERCDD